MTENGATRLSALMALRRRDRAEALIQLREALDHAEKIAADEAANRREIQALEQRLNVVSGARDTNAGRLQRHIDYIRLKKTALRKRRQMEASLAAAFKETSARIDAAKERVAKSQKALRTLEERETVSRSEQNRRPR